MARSRDRAVVTISRPDICSAASDPSSGIAIRGVSAPGSSKVNSSSRAAGSRSESSRRSVHSRLVGVLPGRQDLLVVLGPIRRRDEHPHQQLARWDRRIVAVLQQHGPLHRAGEETLPQLVIDYPLDLVKLGPFHGASIPDYPLTPSTVRRFRRGMSEVSAGMLW